MTQKITNEKTYRSVAFRGTPDRPKIRDLGDCQSRLGAGTKAWDKKLLGLDLLLTLAILVIAGLDSGRFHWSPHLQLRSAV